MSFFDGFLLLVLSVSCLKWSPVQVIGPIDCTRTLLVHLLDFRPFSLPKLFELFLIGLKSTSQSITTQLGSSVDTLDPLVYTFLVSSS